MNPPDSYTADDAITTISGNRFIVRTDDGAVLLEGRFVLDATLEPKSITWIDAIGPDAGKQLPAGYLLDKDRFVFVAADERAPRPVVFRTTIGQVMRSFVRAR